MLNSSVRKYPTVRRLTAKIWSVSQNKTCLLSVLLMPLISAHLSKLTLRGSAGDKTHVSTVALPEYVFMSVSMFVINNRDKTCLS